MGCGDVPLDLWLGLPPPQGASSLLIGVPEADTVEIFVADTQGGIDDIQVNLRPRLLSDPAIEAAYFSRSLDAAGLQPGWQTPANPSKPIRTLTGGPEAAFETPQATFSALLGDAGRWLPSDELSARIANYEIFRPEARCRGVHTPRIAREIEIGVTWAVPLSPNVVLLSAADGHYLLATPSGDVQKVVVNAPFTAGVFHEGWAYLGDANGQLWRVRGDPTLGLMQQTMLGEALGQGIVTLSSNGPNDIFVLAADGAIHHFDGTMWRRSGTASNIAKRMIHIAPQQALITADAVGIIYEVTPDHVQAETVGPVGVLSLANLAVMGVLAGTSDGELLQRDKGVWNILGDKRYGWWLTDIVPYEGGAAFVLASGTVGGFHEDVGHCEDLFTSAYVRDGRLVVQQDGLLFIGEVPGAGRTQIALLEPN